MISSTVFTAHFPGKVIVVRYEEAHRARESSTHKE